MTKEIIDRVEKVIGYEFSNKALLIQAFTRESYAKEQRVKVFDCEGNEQLEFFGDSVLKYLVVSGALDNFTNVVEETGLHVMYKEGKLSEFISHWTDKNMLSSRIDALGLAQYLIMSKGDINQKANENKSVKEDLFEALIGAMWIDSGKDVNKIIEAVYNMLCIEFDKKTEKNYYSQIIEWSDKNKCSLKREVIAFECGYEVELTVDLTPIYGKSLLPDEDNLWSGKGIGKTIKEAEQAAAKELLETLYNYGNLKRGPRFQEEFTRENAINKLQEYAQKGEIGQITYTDSLEFGKEEQYWLVTCYIANMSIAFDGAAKYKKDAKKEAAYNALMFLKYNMNGNVATKFNPLKKKEIYLLNQSDNGDYHLSVLLVDKYESLYYSGIMYPEKVEKSVYSTLNEIEEFESIVEAAGRYALTLSPWNIDYRVEAPQECKDDGYRLQIYIREEYKKVPQEIKEDGLKLIAKMEEIARNFKWHPTARKIEATKEQKEEYRRKFKEEFGMDLPDND